VQVVRSGLQVSARIAWGVIVVLCWIIPLAAWWIAKKTIK
jgi:hypothetical protein